MIFIGQINSVPIGIIRFDLVVDGPVYEVSLSLAPEHCCKGLGAACKEGNGPVASGRVFQRCGFLEERVNGMFVTYSREASGRAQDSLKIKIVAISAPKYRSVKKS